MRELAALGSRPGFHAHLLAGRSERPLACIAHHAAQYGAPRGYSEERCSDAAGRQLA